MSEALFHPERAGPKFADLCENGPGKSFVCLLRTIFIIQSYELTDHGIGGRYMPATDDESQRNEMEEVDTDSEGECPWERRSMGGAVRAYGVTVKEILLDTSAFFSKLSPRGSYWEPFLFALATIIAASFGVELLATLKDWAPIDPSVPGSSLRMKIMLGKFTLRDACQAASIVLIGSMFQVIACHLTLKRLCSTYQGFQGTWRVYFYAQSTQLAYMMPFIGAAMGPVWYAIVLTVGLAQVHRTRIETAVFGPIVIASVTVFLRLALQLGIFWSSQMRLYDSGLLWPWILTWI
ncbi:MAG: hypothetical protein V2B18_17765 [Pseudomonadota bacterium]